MVPPSPSPFFSLLPHVSSTHTPSSPTPPRVPDELGEVAPGYFLEFLRTFIRPLDDLAPPTPGAVPHPDTPHYLAEAEIMLENGKNTLFVDMEHLRQYDAKLAEGISVDYVRFEPFLRRAVKRLTDDILAEEQFAEDAPQVHHT